MYPDAARVPGTPTALFVAVGVAFAALAASLAEGYFWVSAARTAMAELPDPTDSNGARESVTGFTAVFILLLTISLAISATMTLGAGALLRGRPGGRTAIVIAGVAGIIWHLCCSLSVFFFRLTITGTLDQAQRSDEVPVSFDQIEQALPVWQVDAATLAGFAAGILSIVVIICVSQASVNRYVRMLRGLPG